MVLDTNAVLDWLVFQDPGMAAVAAALQAGALRWLACAPMRAELARTLGYRSLTAWSPDREHTLSVFDRLAHLQRDPPPAAQTLRCSDPDDQVFLELALAQGARWLLTHDRALLRLARRTRPLGLLIVPPHRWSATDAHA